MTGLKRICLEFLVTILLGLILFLLFWEPLMVNGLLTFRSSLLIYTLPSLFAIFIGLKSFNFFNEKLSMKFDSWQFRGFESPFWLFLSYLIIIYTTTYLALYFYIGTTRDFQLILNTIYHVDFQRDLLRIVPKEQLTPEFYENLSKIFLYNNQEVRIAKFIPTIPIAISILIFSAWLINSYIAYTRRLMLEELQNIVIQEKRILQKIKEL